MIYQKYILFEIRTATSSEPCVYVYIYIYIHMNLNDYHNRNLPLVFVSNYQRLGWGKQGHCFCKTVATII